MRPEGEKCEEWQAALKFCSEIQWQAMAMKFIKSDLGVPRSWLKMTRGIVKKQFTSLSYQTLICKWGIISS